VVTPIHYLQMMPHASQLALYEQLLKYPPVQRNSWQGTDAPASAHELWNVVVQFEVSESQHDWEVRCQPDMPWAETHFKERISGVPYNPPPSYAQWPWHTSTSRDQFLTDGKKFDHTYPERFWPDSTAGNLADVCQLLSRDTWSRQAYLPVWFPQDTGSRENQRVPCTLGYHFIRNGSALDCNYFLRSCDLTRHYKNDVYLAGRLLQHVVSEIRAPYQEFPYAGTLTLFISNLHLFTPDKSLRQYTERQLSINVTTTSEV
jgi:thymidylate synthase